MSKEGLTVDVVKSGRASGPTPIDSVRALGPPPIEIARLAADAIADKKGQDIVLLEVGDIFVITDVFVIATGTSRPHVQSLADKVEEHLKSHGRKPLRDEGRPEAEWVLLDYGDVMVHLFQPSAREYYNLERLWRDAPTIEWTPAVSEA